jgi:cytochrome c oxidase subunit 2
MFDPKSPQALAISNLFIITLLIAAVIFAIVTGLVIYIAIKYRARGEETEPRQVFGHTRLEIGWTLGPLLIVTFLFVMTAISFPQADPASDIAVRAADIAAGKQPDRQADIEIVAHQWWWEIKYPQANVTTANEIHLPVGKEVLVKLGSADVVHDLWIPKLSRKMDITPGHVTYIAFRADAPGTYDGACAEYCGVEHAWMRIRAIAQPQAEFDAWLQGQAQSPPLPTGGLAAQGLKTFKEETCINCHAINGAGANARVGPDLSHFGSRQTIGSGVLDNTPDNLAKWLRDPQAVKPGIYMPNLRLTNDEVNALVAYMESLK